MLTQIVFRSYDCEALMVEQTCKFDAGAEEVGWGCCHIVGTFAVQSVLPNFVCTLCLNFHKKCATFEFLSYDINSKCAGNS